MVIDRRDEPLRFTCPKRHYDWCPDCVDGREVIVCRGCLQDTEDCVYRRLDDSAAETHLDLAAEYPDVRDRSGTTMTVWRRAGGSRRSLARLSTHTRNTE